MADTIEKIYCSDRDNNDNALAAAILAGNNRRDDWGPMAAMMGGGINNWMNNPFAYPMFLALFCNGGFGGWGYGNCVGVATQGIETQRQIADFRADVQLQNCKDTGELRNGQRDLGVAIAQGFSQVAFQAQQDKCDIIRAGQDKEHEDEKDVVVESRIATPHGEHKVKFDLPYEQTANALMSAKGYSEYVKKHGYHFTDALAEHVSKMMENANGQQHTWTTSQVKKSMESLGLTIPSHVTHGDAAYLANMYYADLYPDPLKDEASCLRAAYKVANDPDGYEGMIFCRWTADVIGKAISINWEKFI